MMCALRAAERGRAVCLLDHSAKIGRKILISGGGRCNFTNIHAGPANFVSQNPHFAKSALSRFTPEDFIKLVRKHRISYHEKKLGQLFCDGSAGSIVDLLVSECRDAGAKFRLSCDIRSIRKEERFIVQTNLGEFRSDAIVVATGGLSIPKIGATGFGYDIAKQFGLKIVSPFPALVGFNFSPQQMDDFAELAGVSVDSEVSSSGPNFRENILFTHTGLSGPAILQASLYWKDGQELLLNLCPEKDLEEWLLQKKKAGAKVEMKNLMADVLPKRLAERFSQLYAKPGRVAELPDRIIVDLAKHINSWKLVPRETFGYQKAEVTRGGVDTSELSSKTMESKKVSGLYFIGEVVDVTGQLGGYNFQWAWASGHAAGESV